MTFITITIACLLLIAIVVAFFALSYALDAKGEARRALDQTEYQEKRHWELHERFWKTDHKIDALAQANGLTYVNETREARFVRKTDGVTDTCEDLTP